MNAAEVKEEGRGVPSVNERRQKAVRARQLLFVASLIVCLGIAAIWLSNIGKKMLTSSANTVPNITANAATPQQRVFAFSAPDSGPAASAPLASSSESSGKTAPTAGAALPGVAPVVPAVAKPSAPPSSATQSAGDPMMLAGESRAGGSSVQNTTHSIAPALDSGPLAAVLQSSKTTRARASLLGNRDFILPKGSVIDCVLNTRLVSTVSGMTSCTVTRDIFSDNGRVVLIEKGSTVTGEYSSNLQPGKERLFVIWDRIKTTMGVVIDANSPAADELGTAGVEGDINNHWMNRIGAAVLLSLVQDAVIYKTTQETAAGGVAILPNTSNESNTLAGKILDKTINIPPALSRDQGTRVSVFVARDLDFSSVYELVGK